MKCYNCGNTSIYDYQDTCSQCNAYVHCCKNCQEYDEDGWSSTNNCKAGKWEQNKTSRNFCDAFKGNDKLW
ncbi:MAG: hypothetical protein SNJ64_01500 [Endomicrobiia bacterium]